MPNIKCHIGLYFNYIICAPFYFPYSTTYRSIYLSMSSYLSIYRYLSIYLSRIAVIAKTVKELVR